MASVLYYQASWSGRKSFAAKAAWEKRCDSSSPSVPGGEDSQLHLFVFLQGVVRAASSVRGENGSVLPEALPLMGCEWLWFLSDGQPMSLAQPFPKRYFHRVGNYVEAQFFSSQKGMSQ